ncbi:hypothetical protein KCU67_g120, partial [Aureobasidium melanogenum]
LKFTVYIWWLYLYYHSSSQRQQHHTKHQRQSSEIPIDSSYKMSSVDRSQLRSVVSDEPSLVTARFNNFISTMTTHHDFLVRSQRGTRDNLKRSAGVRDALRYRAGCRFVLIRLAVPGRYLQTSDL